MNIQQLKQSLPYLMKASVPALVWGHHGIGKTESVRQFCDDNEYFCRVLNLGTQEVGDIIGLADFIVDANSGQKIATKFMVPDWVKELYDFCVANPDKYGVLFLDEVNRARRDVLQVIFPLLLEKRIHTTVFPKNFYVMAGANPSTQDYIVTDVSDKALLDRFCHIKLGPSKQEWFEYARKQNFDPVVIQFLQEQPKMLQTELEAFSLDVMPSRRSWEMVHKILETKPPINVSRDLILGLVGLTATTAFIKSMNSEDKPITAKEIFSDYPKIKKRVKKYADPKNGRMDMLKYTADSIAETAAQRNQKNDALTKDEEKNLSDFLLDIPKDLAFDLCRTIYMEDITRDVIEKNEKLLKLFADARDISVEGVNK